MKKSGGKKKPSTAAKLRAAVTPEALIEQGNVALAKMQPELASQFFSRAHQMKPDDTNIMDALADVLLQLGDTCQAQTLLEASTSLAPTENPYKWCYLAQLQSGLEAVTSYLRGIEILTATFSTADEVKLTS